MRSNFQGWARPDRFLDYLFLRYQIPQILTKADYKAKVAGLPKISGPVIIAGSAPEPTLPIGVDNSWFRISINASQVVFDSFNLGPPNITIFQPKIKSDDAGRHAKWKALSGRGTDHLIFAVNRKNDGKIEDFLRSKSYQANAITSLRETYKNALVRDVAGVTLITPYKYQRSVSNGMFGVFLALKLGGNPVVLCGFSVMDGWFHTKELPGQRNHLLIDKRACERIVQLGLPVYTSERGFSEAMGLPLWNGDRLK